MALHRGVLGVAVLTLMLCAPAVSCELDGFEEEADVKSTAGATGLGPKAKVKASSFASKGETTLSGAPAAGKAQNIKPKLKSKLVLKMPEHWYYEAVALAAMVVYIVMAFVGAMLNDRIGRRFASWIADPANALHKQFSIVGCGPDKYQYRGGLLTKESRNEWMLHCSGRQNCKHMLATWQLRRRQDLWSLLWELYYPGRDLLKVNVAMNDTAMEPMVLVAGRANPVRDLRRDMPEVDKYTERVKASPDRRKPWVANNVVVWSEGGEVTEGILTGALLELLSESGMKGLGKYFQSLYVSDKNAEAAHRHTPKMLCFSFQLPEREEQVAALFEVVCRTVDAVGRLKLSNKAKSNAINRRQKPKADQDEKDAAEVREREVARRRAEKKKKEEEAEKGMSREQLRKKEEREKKRALVANLKKGRIQLP